MFLAKNDEEQAAPTGEALDLELSAAIYLLARCAQCPGDAAQVRLAVHHLERVACHASASALLRQTAGQVAAGWQSAGSVPGGRTSVTH